MSAENDSVGLDSPSLVPRDGGSTTGDSPSLVPRGGGSTIGRLMVANRAEIASRVFRTCRRLGIETVAVHSDADAELPYVREADYVVPVPGSAPAETYLRADLLVEAARRSGADAVHPGYGFLSENADFARAVEEAGLTWVGPTPESIEAMGSKIGAKEIMKKAGVPVLEAPESPTDADLPLLVKASAGGGGRGMRVVRSLPALEDEVAAAEAEAASAFGDGTVFVEPYVEHGRHVEVQVVGDGAGGVLVLGERDCSMQRRHQKVVEESPAPRLPDATRTALHEAARAAAEAIDYRGAGTVEFLYDPVTDRFWFLEMNTRLQVEHPVTELVHGVDLVELQIAVAEGRDWVGSDRVGLDTPSLVPHDGGSTSGRGSTSGAGSASGGGSTSDRVGLDTPSLVPHDGGSTSGGGSTSDGSTGGPVGHAIEVRLYAEDPAHDYQPQSGVLTKLVWAEGARVDAGYETGSTVSTFYDAMLAKVIVHAPTREQAVRQLVGVLRRTRIHGLVTNRDQLIGILTSAEFGAGEVSTSLLAERKFIRQAEDPGAPVAAAIALAESARRPGYPAAWRNVTSQPQRTTFVGRAASAGDLGGRVASASDLGGRVASASDLGGRVASAGDLGGRVASASERIETRIETHVETTVEWYGTRTGYTVVEPGPATWTVISAAPDRVVLERDGVRSTYAVSIRGAAGSEHVDVDGASGHTALRRTPRFTDPATAAKPGSLLAPMPGTVVSVAAAKGDEVVAGQPLLVLEAMKMQHTVTAPAAGVVAEINVEPGAQVAAGEVLAVVEERERQA